MKKNQISAVLGIICSVVILVTSLFMGGWAKAAPPPQEPYRIVIYTSRPGSTMFVLGIALADLINKHSTWLRATAIESPGVEANAKMLALEQERRKNTLGWITQSALWQLERRSMPGVNFHYDTLKVVSFNGGSAGGFATLDPKIKSVRDLAGKKVALMPKAIWGMSTLYEIMFERLGIKAKFSYMGADDAVGALKDRTLDAAIVTAFLIGQGKFAPTPAHATLIATAVPYYVSYTPEEVLPMLKGLGSPLSAMVVPAGEMAPTQTMPWVITGTSMLWGADVEMPNHVVYEIVRVIYENAEKFKEFDRTGAVLTKETVSLVEVNEKMVHPGALKFFKEKGLKLGKIKGFIE